MSKPKIIFIELAVARKTRYICDIAEKAYNSGLTVHIYCHNSSEAARIDQELWTWKQDAFVPHNQVANLDSNDCEPVLIGTDVDFPEKAEVLILFDPADKSCFKNYKYVVDFAETYAPDKLKDSRIRYKEIRDLPEFDLSFTKLGSFLGSALS